LSKGNVGVVLSKKSCGSRVTSIDRILSTSIAGSPTELHLFRTSYAGQASGKRAAMPTVLIVEDDFAILLVADPPYGLKVMKPSRPPPGKMLLPSFAAGRRSMCYSRTSSCGASSARVWSWLTAVKLRPELGVLYTTGGNARPPTGAGSGAARGLLNWTVQELAEKIAAIDSGRYASDAETLTAICRVLEAAGVKFTNGRWPGVRLRPERRRP
jgi:hypothetical protein